MELFRLQRNDDIAQIYFKFNPVKADDEQLDDD